MLREMKEDCSRETLCLLRSFACLWIATIVESGRMNFLFLAKGPCLTHRCIWCLYDHSEWDVAIPVQVRPSLDRGGAYVYITITA